MTHCSSAQPWCPVLGAQCWHTYSPKGGLYDSVLTTSTNDSLIAGESGQKLNVNATYRDLSSNGPVVTESWCQLTRTVGATVLLRQAEQVDTLYRFDALVGDRWSVSFVAPLELTYVVTGVGDTVLDGSTLGWTAVDVVTDDGFLYSSDTLVERVGFLDRFINPVGSLNVAPNILDLRCYSDNDLDYHAEPGIDCNVALQVGGYNEQLAGVWYDASLDRLNIEVADPRPGSYQLLDLSGRVFGAGMLETGVTPINVGGSACGAFILRTTDRSGSSWTRKWVKL